MNSMIIGITGLHQDSNKTRLTIGAGKDAAAARLVEKHGFVRIGIADHLKRICRDVFEFTDDQLWGPSEERNRPDFRYPRGGKHGLNNRQQLDAFKQEFERLEQAGFSDTAKYESRARDLRRNIQEWEAMAYLTPRYALQQLGTEGGRSCYDLVWIDDALRIARRLLSEEGWAYSEKQGLVHLAGSTARVPGVVFSDVRFQNEFKAIKQAGGKLVRIRRFSWKPFAQHVDSTHQSETELLNYDDDKFDYIIDNAGDLPHLGTLVDRMVDVLQGKIRPFDEAQQDVPPGLRP